MLIECNDCNAVVQGAEIGSYTDSNPFDPTDSQKYTLCKCPQCSSPLLAREDLVFFANDFEWSHPIKLYPGNLFHINPVIPEKLREALAECIKCYKSNAFTATAIMCRRTIEGFCRIKGVEENNLDKAIKKLKDDGIINEQLYDWANHLRLVGNEAAHNIDSQFSSIDAKDIMDFTIAILDFTFSFKDKFDQFKERLASREKTSR